MGDPAVRLHQQRCARLHLQRRVDRASCSITSMPTRLRWYWHEVIDPIIADAGPLCGRSWKMVQTDSWELGGVNWTATLPRGIPQTPRLRPPPVAAGHRRPDRREPRRQQPLPQRFPPHDRRLHRRQPLRHDGGAGAPARPGHPARIRRPAHRAAGRPEMLRPQRLADERVLGPLAAPADRRIPLLRQAGGQRRAHLRPDDRLRRRLHLDRAAMERHLVVVAEAELRSRSVRRA